MNSDLRLDEPLTGQPADRADGRLKVTGAARYASDWALPRLSHGVLLTSGTAKGRIARIDTTAARAMPGVLLVMTHDNAPRLPKAGQGAFGPPAGRRLTLLQDDRVDYQNQPIAIVVADTFEHAVDAANHISVTYQVESPRLDMQSMKSQLATPERLTRDPVDTTRGAPDTSLQSGSAHVDAVYTTPFEYHLPMEPHATTAEWDGDSLTLYDATQGISGCVNTVSKTLGIEPAKVHVICPFVGGGFGSKGSVWSHVVLTAMAAKAVGRPVRLALQRPQMFGMVGHRPQTEQHIRLAAQADGRLVALRHDVVSTTSTFEDWTESSAVVSRMLYDVPNAATTHRLARINTGTPTFTRAPGEASGSFALEAAMDEMAYALNMDPLELRLRNYAERDPQDGKPFSSKSLRDCYTVGAQRFGWSRRSMAPRSMRDGDQWIGWGMATASYPANRSPASAFARIQPDGTAIVGSGTQDLGTGTYTIMTQVAADALGFPMQNVRFALGDSTLPAAPVSGGSQSAASVSPAVQAAALSARDRLIGLAVADSASPVHGASPDDVFVKDGWVTLKADPSRRDPAAAIIARNGGQAIEATVQVKPSDDARNYSKHSFGAVFAEVRVDEMLGVIRVSRIVAVYDVGRLLNEKTAHSQLMGGIVWGVGQALTEEGLLDPRYGRIANNNFAEYHVPVNADIGSIDISVIESEDMHLNPLGARGIGEIGITGVAGAVGNAVYHATGVRVRSLPITLDKVIRA
ncbi:xanthine dehydrogenase YagR molybdenum-binding subunit [Pararobbsia alpina]|uniref:xanthine dehydrogenase family protein molybdopterin-binding subunit n=1 Tax=Pararobbsia alpina TaxID=621374 RepID=UPI0039A4F0C9